MAVTQLWGCEIHSGAAPASCMFALRSGASPTTFLPLHLVASARGRGSTAPARRAYVRAAAAQPSGNGLYARNPLARRRRADLRPRPRSCRRPRCRGRRPRSRRCRRRGDFTQTPRRRDPHLRGGPGRRPQPPAHDGLLRGRQGQEGRDLRRLCRGRRRCRSPAS